MLGWLLGFLWLFALKGWLALHPALDSDALGVADVWRSLAGGGHLGDWTFGPHPYVFPDLPLYALAARFSHGVLGAQLAFGLVQGFLIWWLLARLFRRLADLDASTARAYAAAGLLLLLPFLGSGDGPGLALVPGYHGGALLCGLALLAWAARQDRDPSSFVGTAWAASWTGLVWASDQLTPACALVPVLVFSLGLGGRARRRVWGLAALACLARWGALAALRARGARVAAFQWSYVRTHAEQVFGAFLTGAWPSLARAAWPLGLGLLAWALLAGFSRARPPRAWLAAAALASLALGLAVSAAEGGFEQRYVLLWVWMGLPWLPLLAAQALDGSPLPLLACALLGLLLPSAGPSGAASAGPPTPQAQADWLRGQCSARGDADQGLACYDEARPLRLLGGGGLDLLPVRCDGGSLLPDPWFEDRTRFRPGFRVRFVVLNGLDPGAVLRALGPAAERIQGEGLTVWFYGRGAAARARHL